MEERLHQTQQQRMQQRLLPLQVRYGRMLEMSGPEVEDEVRQMLDDNPALCEVHHEDASTGDDAFSETSEEIQLADFPNEDEIPYRQAISGSGTNAIASSYGSDYADDSVSLTDHLVAQLPDLRLSDTDNMVAIYVIGNLNENGYLERSPRSIAHDIEQVAAFTVTPYDVERIIEHIRQLDPAGVGASDLRDCLLLQLMRMPRTRDVDNATVIVDKYFEMFTLRHFRQLASAAGFSDEELKAAVDIIRTLNPKPGAAYNISSHEQRNNYIIPDFSVEADGDRLTVTALNVIPELAIETTFTADAEDAMSDRSDARLFVKQKREEAQDFIHLLHMRQTTLMRVMRAIVELQTPFFLDPSGDRSLLRPMILRQISEKTGLDISVISRATSGKYVATASGIYPLKMFFSERFHDEANDVSENRGDMSSHGVLEAIRTLINEEDKKNPLSDEAIAAELHRRGMDIARRTVAKYRERLGMPVARLRRTI
ncbi:MAG: RNA polymerase factor sigma-54 [Muribaculum sp.]|nr:RNA polymerase factor sigma-54 [Muribaculum sp.]